MCMMMKTNDTSSNEGDESKLEIRYVSPVAGRALGAVPVPRFDLTKIRPFEVMFVDNKDYEQAVRGGRQTTFILYDVCSTAPTPAPKTQKRLHSFLANISVQGERCAHCSLKKWLCLWSLQLTSDRV